MRILHIARTMGQGGAEKIVFQLCCDSKKQYQCVASCGGMYEKALDEFGIRHYRIPDMSGKNIVLMLKSLIILYHIVKKEKIDIIHTHHRMAAFYARIILFFMPYIRHVYTSHNTIFNKRALVRYALKGAYIIAVGEDVKDNLVVNYGIPSDQIRIIYNTVKVETRPGRTDRQILDEKEKRRYRIGYIGRLSQEKGVDILIKAIKEVMARGLEIVAVIVGDGESHSPLKRMAEELDICDRVIFLGYREDIYDIIDRLDIIVSPSRSEGFPLVPIEVFSQGKTMIVSDIPGNNEIVIDKYNGILFETENVKDLADKMEWILQNETERKRMEKNAKITFERKFSYEGFLKSYEQVYEECFR